MSKSIYVCLSLFIYFSPEPGNRLKALVKYEVIVNLLCCGLYTHITFIINNEVYLKESFTIALIIYCQQIPVKVRLILFNSRQPFSHCLQLFWRYQFLSNEFRINEWRVSVNITFFNI